MKYLLSPLLHLLEVSSILFFLTIVRGFYIHILCFAFHYYFYLAIVSHQLSWEDVGNPHATVLVRASAAINDTTGYISKQHDTQGTGVCVRING